MPARANLPDTGDCLGRDLTGQGVPSSDLPPAEKAQKSKIVFESGRPYLEQHFLSIIARDLALVETANGTRPTGAKLLPGNQRLLGDLAVQGAAKLSTVSQPIVQVGSITKQVPFFRSAKAGPLITGRGVMFSVGNVTYKIDMKIEITPILAQ